ncbi:MAG: hypothetical protein ACOYJK_01045 [Prevotella sp.]|jgi:hypothetical protein
MMKSLRLMATMLLLAVFGMVSAQTVVFQETFDQVLGEGGNDNVWSGINASSTNNIKSDNDGWAFGNLKQGFKCVILGSTKNAGSATTPEIELNGNGTLTFRAGAWVSKKEKKVLNLSITSGTLSESQITLEKGKFTEYTVQITDATAPVKITFETAATGYNRFFLDDVVVTSTSETAKTATTLAFEHPEGYSFTVADGEQTFTNQATLDPVVEKAAITYAIDNEDVAIIDENTGYVMTTGRVGTAKVTAEYAGNDSYSGSTASYTITVTDPNAKGSIGNPYSPSEALAAYNPNKTTECYIKGIISEIQEVSTKYGNATYYISDDGTSNNPLYVFRGKWIGGVDFTATDQIVVGGSVLVKGTMKTFHNPQIRSESVCSNQFNCYACVRHQIEANDALVMPL